MVDQDYINLGVGQKYATIKGNQNLRQCQAAATLPPTV
jgi:hypothetical protein